MNNPRTGRIRPLSLGMPYKNDVRRTITLNLHPDEYAAIAGDAFTAGHERPGTYAKALVLNRGDALAPILDECTEERLYKLEGAKQWLLQQLEAAQAQLQQAGLPVKLASRPAGEPSPRSWPAQERAVAQAVATALQQERARVARKARRAAAESASADAVPSQTGANPPRG